MLKIEIFQQIDSLPLFEKERYLVLVTEKFFYKLDAIREKFVTDSYYGVLVPYLIAHQRLIGEGIAVISFKKEESFGLIVSMECPQLDGKITLNKTKSILLFVDGLSPYLESFVQKMNEVVTTQKVIGTGVGNRNLVPQACIFDHKEVYQNHALLIGTSLKLDIGVRHGWHPLYGPLVVTKSEKNLVYEINGEPAFEVYKQALKEKENIEITPENFTEIARAYPFGIVSFKEDEFIIRDPISVNPDKSLTIVSSIPAFSTVFIMKGTPSNLINAGCKVSWEVFNKTNGKVGILFDCVSRVLFLGNGFEDEIKKIISCAGKRDIEIFGLTSIGEITNAGHEEIKVFNKTILLGVIENGQMGKN